MNFDNAKWRKATDIDREFAIFELIVEGEIILDVGFSDSNVLEIAFHGGISNKKMNWSEFEKIVKVGLEQAKIDAN